MNISFWCDDATAKRLDVIKAETRRSIEDLASSAVAEAALSYFSHRDDPGIPLSSRAIEIRELTKVERWKLRECSICGTGLHYLISPDKQQVAFQSGCACTRSYSEPRPSSWNEIAETVDRQNEQVRAEMLAQLAGSA